MALNGDKMFDFSLDLYDEDGKLVEADENGYVNLLPYIHQKLIMHCVFRPVHALRCIEIEIPPKVFAAFNRHKAYNCKVRTSRKGSTPWFKNEYDRIGRGQKHIGRKHA